MFEEVILGPVLEMSFIIILQWHWPGLVVWLHLTVSSGMKNVVLHCAQEENQTHTHTQKTYIQYLFHNLFSLFHKDDLKKVATKLKQQNHLVGASAVA